MLLELKMAPLTNTFSFWITYDKN